MSPQNEEVTIIGIDCATKLENVGVAVGSYGGGVCVEKPFLGNDTEVRKKKFKKHVCLRDLVEYLVNKIQRRHRVLLALDAPLGWPDGMRTELAAHAAGRPLAIGRQRMFSRVTDRFVCFRTEKDPLDVGADKIAKTAHWALDLLKQLREATGKEIPLAWTPRDVLGPKERVAAIEVYPALALSALAPKEFGRCHARTKKEKKYCFRENEPKEFGRGYKNKGESGVCPRGQIWNRLADFCSYGLKKDEQPRTDHEIDAVLCVQIAHEFVRYDCVDPPAEFPMDVLRREGWIWFSQKSCKKSKPEPVRAERWAKSGCCYRAASATEA